MPICDIWINRLDLGISLLWVMPQVEFETQFPISGATILDIKPRGNRFEHYFQHNPHIRPMVAFFSPYSLP